MPVYTVTTEIGLLDAEQREKLAVGITTIHGEETGAPEPLIHVVFMEAGMVLPPTEKDAEAAWDAEFYARYPLVP